MLPFARHWRAFSLSGRYLILGGLVVVVGAVIIGAWVSRQISDGVTQNSAVSAALYIDSFISPVTRSLEANDMLSDAVIRELDTVFKDSPAGRRFISVKIWKLDGQIVYSGDHNMIGQKFTPTEELLIASSGSVSATFDKLGDEEDAPERSTGKPLLEIYSPILAPWSGKVVAVAEFYEDGTKLAATIAEARKRSWVIVGAVMTGMAGVLMTIVYGASRTIDEQRKILHQRLADVTQALQQNHRLREQVQKASEKVTELNEHFLRRTGAELHDGPAQLLGFASLRIGEAAKLPNKVDRDKEFELIRTALDDAMKEIRNVSRGLSLPDIDTLTVEEIIRRVARDHSDRTQMEVQVVSTTAYFKATNPVSICVYRFVQEALNNCWKHALGSMITVGCLFEGSREVLTVFVKDDGPGFDQMSASSHSGKTLNGMGILGLCERVRSIGGEFDIESVPGQGTKLRMSVVVDDNFKEAIKC